MPARLIYLIFFLCLSNLLLGQVLNFDYVLLSNGGANGNLSMNTPYWLSTGNHTVEIFGTAKIGSLSIIEFNVIP